MSIKIEICANSVESANQAEAGGAYSVELCENIEAGGVTPSHGAIEIARKLLNIKLNVLIRPRGGDFCYNKTEIEIMKSDIEFCKSIQADGMVFGVLSENGSVNKSVCKELLEIAKPLDATFHRAFDVTPKPFEALEDIIELGFNRLLTSGQKNTAIEGIDLIKDLVEKASGRIVIMPGSGINEENITELFRLTQADEYHASLREPKEVITMITNGDVFFGDNDNHLMVTSSERVRKIISIVSKIVN